MAGGDDEEQFKQTGKGRVWRFCAFSDAAFLKDVLQIKENL